MPGLAGEDLGTQPGFPSSLEIISQKSKCSLCQVPGVPGPLPSPSRSWTAIGLAPAVYRVLLPPWSRPDTPRMAGLGWGTPQMLVPPDRCGTEAQRAFSCEWCFCPSPHPGYPAAPCPGALAAPFPATASGCTPRQSVPLRFSEPQPGPSARPQCRENRQAGLRVTVRGPACRLGTPALQMSPQVEQTFPLPVTSPKTLKMGMEWEVGLRAGPSLQGPHSVPEETGIEGGACPRPANGSKPPSRPLLSVSPVCPQWA